MIQSGLAQIQPEDAAAGSCKGDAVATVTAAQVDDRGGQALRRLGPGRTLTAQQVGSHVVVLPIRGRNRRY